MQTYNPLPKLKRQSDAILRKARKDFCGGLAYGLDLPTWQSVSPLSCAAWLAKRAEIAREFSALRSAGLHENQIGFNKR